MVGYALLASPVKPVWLEALLCEKFFAACCRHTSFRKNEKNIYCIDCSVGICQHCLSNHCAHRLLQIRRYVYHDVIRLQDIQKLLDCSQVQTYIINSARVVFLNQRPQPRPSKGAGNICDTCERSLQDAYRYCSVACKVDAVLSQGKDLYNLLPRCNSLQVLDLANSSREDCLKSYELESDEQLSPNSVLDATSSPASSGSTANDDLVWENVSSTATTNKICGTNGNTAADLSPGSVIFPSLNRRKGTPHRSPFC
eukprot:c21613_g1_i2 orf=402-1166(-)